MVCDEVHVWKVETSDVVNNNFHDDWNMRKRKEEYVGLIFTSKKIPK